MRERGRGRGIATSVLDSCQSVQRLAFSFPAYRIVKATRWPACDVQRFVIPSGKYLGIVCLLGQEGSREIQDPRHRPRGGPIRRGCDVMEGFRGESELLVGTWMSWTSRMVAMGGLEPTLGRPALQSGQAQAGPPLKIR